MRNTHCRTWIMSRKLKNVENETKTLKDLNYGKKTDKQGKMRNSHVRTWNVVRKTEKRSKMRHTH